MAQVVQQGRYKRAKPEDVCFRCRQKGHWAVDCPTVQPSQQNPYYLASTTTTTTSAPTSKPTTSSDVVARPIFQGRLVSTNNINNIRSKNIDTDQQQQQQRRQDHDDAIIMMNGIRFQKMNGFRKSVNPNDTCHRCGEKGHWAADCPNN